MTMFLWSSGLCCAWSFYQCSAHSLIECLHALFILLLPWLNKNNCLYKHDCFLCMYVYRRLTYDNWSDKGGKLCNVISQSLIWANQETKSFVYLWLALLQCLMWPTFLHLSVHYTSFQAFCRYSGWACISAEAKEASPSQPAGRVQARSTQAPWQGSLRRQGQWQRLGRTCFLSLLQNYAWSQSKTWKFT